MAKGKSKSTIAPNVKAAVCTAALLASGASAKGLRQSRASDKDNEVVVSSFHLSIKQDPNDDPPPNLTVTEKVIAETAPFQMIRQKRSLEAPPGEGEGEGEGEDEGEGEELPDSEKKKKKKKKDKKKKEKKNKKERKKKDKKKRKVK
eukprot:scaffold1644_cov147-Skeletonema_dohrnii-CCMP3373.AAC.4